MVHRLVEQLIHQHEVVLDRSLAELALKVGLEEADQLRVESAWKVPEYEKGTSLNLKRLVIPAEAGIFFLLQINGT